MVRCIRIDGSRKDFNRYDTRAAADNIVRHLVRVGCPAEVIEVGGRPGESVVADVPGRPRELGGCIAGNEA